MSSNDRNPPTGISILIYSVLSIRKLRPWLPAIIGDIHIDKYFTIQVNRRELYFTIQVYTLRSQF